jgi:signal peptidase I
MAQLIFEPLALAVVLAFGVRALVRVYAIPSASMRPTLDVGDHIAVTPYHGGALPQRGDVVVFSSPADPSELVVKRVIATPGELIETQQGLVTIGGQALPEPYLATPASTGAFSPQIVPSGCYFVMGDNRTASLDSRRWGVLPKRFIVGRARLVLWSSSGMTSMQSASASTNPARRTDRTNPARFRFLLPIR